MKWMQRAKNLVASLDALPPLAMCLQLVLEPFVSRFVGAIGYLTIIECANLIKSAYCGYIAMSLKLHMVEDLGRHAYAMLSPAGRT
jgi:hypothetical protein